MDGVDWFRLAIFNQKGSESSDSKKYEQFLDLLLNSQKDCSTELQCDDVHLD
jgi:hypothetical protein